MLLCTGSTPYHYCKMDSYQHADATPPQETQCPDHVHFLVEKHSLSLYGRLFLHSWLHSCAELATSYLCRLTQVSV